MCLGISCTRTYLHRFMHAWPWLGWGGGGEWMELPATFQNGRAYQAWWLDSKLKEAISQTSLLKVPICTFWHDLKNEQVEYQER